MPDRYPGALWSPAAKTGWDWPSEAATAPWRLVLHSTETRGLPNYSNPPHVTIDPDTGQVWQHVEFNQAAYALRHPSGTVHTNGLHCLQVEVIGYARDAADWSRSIPLQEMVQWFLEEFDITDEHPVFRGGVCYGDASPCRMTGTEWRAFNGVCGHQHVPHNTHWDPGRIDIDFLLTAPAPDPVEDVVTGIQRALVAAGFSDTTLVTGVWDKPTQQAFTRMARHAWRVRNSVKLNREYVIRHADEE